MRSPVKSFQFLSGAHAQIVLLLLVGMGQTIQRRRSSYMEVSKNQGPDPK